MSTIDNKIRDSSRWKEAQKSLERFEEMMKIVEQYPIKSMIKAPASPPYTIQEPYKF